MDERTLHTMRLVLREDDIPFFTEEELDLYLEMNKGDVRKALYQCLCIKAEPSNIELSGLITPDTSTYFQRLAAQYRPTNSGLLRG